MNSRQQLQCEWLLALNLLPRIHLWPMAPSKHLWYNTDSSTWVDCLHSTWYKSTWVWRHISQPIALHGRNEENKHNTAKADTQW